MNQSMKTILGIVIVVVLIWFGFELSDNKNETVSSEPIKIGAILQLSGDFSQYGEWTSAGLKMAIEEINEKGGIDGRPIEVIYEDSQADVATAISSFNKLVDVDRVKIVLTQGSPIAVAINPISNSKNIIQMDVGSTALEYRTEGDFSFRTSVTALALADAEANVVISEGVKKVGFLSVNDDYGRGMKSIFTDSFQRLGGSVVVEESFNDKDTDFRTQLLKIKQKDPEALVLVSRLKKSGLIIKQAREIGFDVQIFSDAYGIESEQTLEIAGKSAEGVKYVASDFTVKASESALRFAKKFEAKYGIKPNQINAFGYDGLWAIAHAYKGCKVTDCIKKNLEKINFDGALGQVAYDKTGDLVAKSIILKEVRNGKFVEISR